jgi:hypothetical protein
MSIARRIAELYEVKMNAVLDRAADPREMVDYSYVQLQELLSEVRRGTAGIAAARKRAELRISDLQRAAGRLGGQAVRAGRDDLARQALARRTAMLAQVSLGGGLDRGAQLRLLRSARSARPRACCERAPGWRWPSASSCPSSAAWPWPRPASRRC